MIITLLCFGFSYILYSYMCGILLFKKSNAALKGFPAFCFFLAYCVPWSIMGTFTMLLSLGNITSSDYDIVSWVVQPIFIAISPLYSFSVSMIIVIPREGGNMRFITYDYWRWGIAEVIMGIVYFVITLWLERF